MSLRRTFPLRFQSDQSRKPAIVYRYRRPTLVVLRSRSHVVFPLYVYAGPSARSSVRSAPDDATFRERSYRAKAQRASAFENQTCLLGSLQNSNGTRIFGRFAFTLAAYGSSISHRWRCNVSTINCDDISLECRALLEECVRLCLTCIAS